MTAIVRTSLSVRRIFAMTVALVLLGGAANAQKKSAPAAPHPAAPPAAHTAAPARPGTTPGAAQGANRPAGSVPHGVTNGGTRPAAGGTAPATRPGATTAGTRPGYTTAGQRPGTSTPGQRPNYTTGGPRPAPNATTPHPGGAAPVHPGGVQAVHPVHPGGSFNGRPVAARDAVYHTRSGAEVRMRPGNRPGDVHIPNRNMYIHHELNGNRRIEMERADHSRLVADRRGGYVQRRYLYGGREFGHRTYYYHGRPYDRFYARYPYRGRYIEVYRPVVYYRPAFYGWAYNPWPAPVHYVWLGGPAVVYYGPYFTPAPVYPSASLWLTDYIVSTTLAAAYQESVNAQAPLPPPPAPGSAMTPEVRQQIADEVQRQIALENSEITDGVSNGGEQQAPGVERMLTDNIPHVFVAGAELDLVDSSGGECSVTEGDSLEMQGAPGADAVAADLIVLASKGGQECRKGVTVSVAISDLQEMQNHMRAMIDQGLGELQTRQGTGGLPVVPPSANAAPTKAAFAASAPPPDANVAVELQQGVQDGDKADQQVLTEGQQPADTADAATETNAPQPTATATRPTIGQTIDQIMAIPGNATKQILSGK